MRISIITISFNQKKFLERTIKSVLQQDYPHIEYIVVDPGSTDGSLDIIKSYSSQISKVILEPDQGAADGLNKGFSHATGEILGFLNSDDILLPGAISRVVDFLKQHPKIDVVSGDTIVIDENDNKLRYCFSDHYSALRAVYNGSFIMQPSTFFRSHAFERSGGFNPENSSNWDGELWIDMYMNGSKFGNMHGILSGYRIHSESITGSARLTQEITSYRSRMFKKVMGRSPRKYDVIIAMWVKIFRYLSNSKDVIQRIFCGPVYGRRSS